MERIRSKDLFIDSQTTEMKQLRATVQSQESSISYFKQKNEDLAHEIEQL
jgi:cell division protein FtsB